MGVEVDGVQMSADGGNTWTRVAGGMDQMDIHDIAVARDGRVYVCAPADIYLSDDKGASWRRMEVGPHFPFGYCRGITLRGDDPDAIMIASGDAAVGSTGALNRTTDGGQSWTQPNLTVRPNSPVWGHRQPSVRSGPGGLLQPLRTGVYQSRRRRELAKEPTGVYSDAVSGFDTQCRLSARTRERGG